MRKIYFLFVAMIASLAVNAQGVNLDFETWTNNTTCTGWTTASAQDSISQLTTPFPTIEGASSMIVANTQFTNQGGSDSLGGSWVEQLIAVVPDSVVISVAGNMSSTDTAYVTVGLVNGTSYLGGVVFKMYASNTPTPGSFADITYDLTGGSIPTFDKILVYCYSSKSPASTSSFVVMDDVRIYEPSGAGFDEQDMSAIRIYPNPASSEVNFNLGNNDADYIKVLDLSGRIVDNITVNSSIETLSTVNYQNGVYFYQVINNNEVVKTDKFVVSK